MDLAETVKKMKRDILSLKTNSNTTGDSATAYEMVIELGDYPTDYQHDYRWDFYFEPKVNAENAIFMPSVREGYQIYHDSYAGDVVELAASTCVGGPDVQNPKHIMVIMSYYNRTYITKVGVPTLCVTSNVPFDLMRSSRTTISIA